MQDAKARVSPVQDRYELESKVHLGNVLRISQKETLKWNLVLSGLS